MQKLISKDKTYNIPTGWSDITITKLYEVNAFISNISEDDDYDDNYFYSNLFGIFNNVKPIEYYSLNLADSLKFKTLINFIVTNKIPDEPFSNEFKYGNLVFKVKNFNNFTFGEYLDTQHLSSSVNAISVIKLLSTMIDVYEQKNILKLRFRDKKLELTPDKKEELIGSLPATKVNAIQGFFLLGQKQLGKSTASYLNKVARGLRIKAYLRMAGRITSGFKMLAMKISLKWKMWLKYRSYK